MPFQGTIPVGNYTIIPSEIHYREDDWAHGWEQARVELHPDPVNNMHGRDQFYLNGSLADNGYGSAGCIDLGLADKFILTVLENNGADTIQLIVKYTDYLIYNNHPIFSTQETEELLLAAAAEFQAAYISPIVFDLDGDGIELTHVNDGVNFDLDNNGIAEQTGWLGKDDGFLVKDLNGNGKIDNQSEMFGTDNTSTALQKLIALDTNNNGKVEGTELSALRIWKDINQDGVTQAGELQTLESAGIGSIPTTPSTNTDALINGNILDWQATWLKADGTAGGKFGDVFFKTNQLDGWYVGAGLTTPTINPEALLLPLSRSYGALKPLHLAAANDNFAANSIRFYAA